MDEPYRYEIRVEGCLGAEWADWFAGLEVCAGAPGETALRGRLADQAALFGVLGRIRALNLTLISVQRLAPA